jgi:tetratricopeptide (TPR) repeat protein
VSVACALYEECLSLDPLNANYICAILNNRANALLKIGDSSKALEDLDTALEINPEYTKAYLKKGDIYLEKEQL